MHSMADLEALNMCCTYSEVVFSDLASVLSAPLVIIKDLSRPFLPIHASIGHPAAAAVKHVCKSQPFVSRNN